MDETFDGCYQPWAEIVSELPYQNNIMTGSLVVDTIQSMSEKQLAHESL
jgi:hypothetical protein